MIEINLLPEDRRPVERTPLPRFLVILVGVIGFCVEGVFLIMIVADFPRQEAFLTAANREIDNANENLKQMRIYETDIKEYNARNTEIKTLYRFRRTWAPLLQQMSSREVLPENIWYREIELRQGKIPRGKKTAPQELFLWGSAQGDEDSTTFMAQATQDINVFVDNLEKHIENYENEFLGGPMKEGPVEIEDLSPPKGAPANIPHRAAYFGIKLIVKPKKPSKAGGGAKTSATGNRN